MTPLKLEIRRCNWPIPFGLNRLHQHPFFLFHKSSTKGYAASVTALKNADDWEINVFYPIIQCWIPRENCERTAGKRHCDWILAYQTRPAILNSDVYIISAILERGAQKPLTLAKSKELGIRIARYNHTVETIDQGSDDRSDGSDNAGMKIKQRLSKGIGKCGQENIIVKKECVFIIRELKSIVMLF